MWKINSTLSKNHYFIISFHWAIKISKTLSLIHMPRFIKPLPVPPLKNPIEKLNSIYQKWFTTHNIKLRSITNYQNKTLEKTAPRDPARRSHIAICWYFKTLQLWNSIWKLYHFGVAFGAIYMKSGLI